MSEKVLVFPRCKIEEAKSGLLLGEYDYLFIDRKDAETSEDFVQLIPYTVFVKGDQILNYSRTKKGGKLGCMISALLGLEDISTRLTAIKCTLFSKALVLITNLAILPRPPGQFVGRIRISAPSNAMIRAFSGKLQS